MPPERDSNGWDEWKRFVLSELERIAGYTKETRDAMDKHCVETRAEATDNYQKIINIINALEIRMMQEVNAVDKKVVALQVKAGFWGIIGGAVLSFCMWGLQELLTKSPPPTP